ncbi:hypothetical protein CgunFtcFv8_018847 [Champsocephalus gunnari]|uniref:Uncharacterized protein n=1 Tax=Champsocephalus gunnari TaxID=52237 RepID=A0AAN8BTP0_CHAGU|nr:hypothetical protein CgunFtcFv8_018847 [Champsocephalus gunnari]
MAEEARERKVKEGKKAKTQGEEEVGAPVAEASMKMAPTGPRERVSGAGENPEMGAGSSSGDMSGHAGKSCEAPKGSDRTENAQKSVQRRMEEEESRKKTGEGEKSGNGDEGKGGGAWTKQKNG